MSLYLTKFVPGMIVIGIGCFLIGYGLKWPSKVTIGLMMILSVFFSLMCD